MRANNNNNNDNINNTCRLCLTKVEGTQYTAIFPQTYINGVSLVTKIMVCVSLTIREDDPFPKKICRGCEESVNSFYSFRETCCGAYFKLIQSIGDSQLLVVANRSSVKDSRSNLSARNCEGIAAQQVNEQLDTGDVICEKSLQRRNSDFDLERNIPQHHIVCIDNENPSVVLKKEFSESRVECRDTKPTEKSKDEEIPEAVEELSSTVDENSLTNYNADVDCYQVEEIHEQIMCGKDVKERVRYKCTRCENNFDDLESVTTHYNDYCQPADYQETKQAFVTESDDVERSSNYLDAFEYLDENFTLESRDTETLRYSNNGQATGEIDSTNDTEISELVEIKSNDTNEEQNNFVTKDFMANYDSTSSCKSNVAINSFILVSKNSCDLKIDGTLNNPTSEPQLVNLAKMKKRKGRWSEKVNYPCLECDRIFSSTSLLKRHSSVHTGERPHVCEICDRRFTQLGQLNFHRKFHNNPRYRCHICSKPFLRPSDIEKHMRTHTGEKPYDCKTCMKSFAQLGALQQHARIHSGEKPYSCEICGKKFSQKANKTKHVKIHKEGERPHTCYVCGRSFSELSEMELHRGGHGGGRPRKCDYCEESFRKLSELNHHIRRFHTFERQHKCMFCPKEFYSIYSLKQHVMVHTGQRPYACSKCDLRFTQKGNLTKHFERKHPEFVDKKKRYILVDDESFGNDNLILMDANVVENNADDQLIVEREETIESEADTNTMTDSKELS